MQMFYGSFRHNIKVPTKTVVGVDRPVVRDGTRRLLLLHESVREKTNQGWIDKSVLRVTLVSRASLVYPYVTHMIDFFCLP